MSRRQVDCSRQGRDSPRPQCVDEHVYEFPLRPEPKHVRKLLAQDRGREEPVHIGCLRFHRRTHQEHSAECLRLERRQLDAVRHLEVDVDQLSGHAAQQRHGVVLRGRPRRIVALGGAKHDCHREETRMDRSSARLRPQRPGFAADVQRRSAKHSGEIKKPSGWRASKSGDKLSAADAIEAAVRADEQVPVCHGDGGAGLVVARLTHVGLVQHLAAFRIDDMHGSGMVLHVKFPIRTGR